VCNGGLAQCDQSGAEERPFDPEAMNRASNSSGAGRRHLALSPPWRESAGAVPHRAVSYSLNSAAAPLDSAVGLCPTGAVRHLSPGCATLDSRLCAKARSGYMILGAQTLPYIKRQSHWVMKALSPKPAPGGEAA